MIDPQSLDLSSLPSVPLGSKSELPNEAAIYFAIDSQRTIQYIGRTANLNQRWQGHHRTKALKAMGQVRIAYLALDADLLPSVENALIKYFDPALNRSAQEKTGIVQLVVEIDKELMENLKALAKAEDRTLKATVIRLLNQAIAAREVKNG